MRIKLILPVPLVAILAACASTGPASNASPSANGGTLTSQPPAASRPAGNGRVDCTTIKTAAAQLLMTQFLAQLTTADAIAQIKAKQIGNLDLDKFLARPARARHARFAAG